MATLDGKVSFRENGDVLELARKDDADKKVLLGVNASGRFTRSKQMFGLYGLISPATDVTTGVLDFDFFCEDVLNGHNLTNVIVRHSVAGAGSPASSIQIQRIRSATTVSMLSTPVTIDAGETSSETAAAAFVINASNDDIQTGDILRVWVTAVPTGTAPKGLSVTIETEAP